jgi:ornithine cyclodeaminase
VSTAALWITEREVVATLDLIQAIDALESGLRQQTRGVARNMIKTHVSWGEGNTLHAIGAVFESSNIAGTKSWAHVEGGATPLLILWDAGTGTLLAVIEAFALGQMRTGAISGVATRWLADAKADLFAMIGTGKQALAQIAAVASTSRRRRPWPKRPRVHPSSR